MRILFVWSGLTGYMGDCWRKLASLVGVELKVSVDLEDRYFGGSFDAKSIMHGIDWSDGLPREWHPDIIFTVGWHNKLCRSAALREDWREVPKVCCFDMPWRRSIRCVVARFVLARYLRRFAAAYVSGISAAKYAKWLGFKRIKKGLFSTNLERFSGEHVGGGGFLYVGRDAKEKGVDVLREAHARYCANGGTWRLRIVHGVQPTELSEIYRRADCFVLASRWEPWGVVLVEAAGAGIPIICSDQCGARFEIVGCNGFVFPTDDVESLCQAMTQMSEMSKEVRRTMGDKGRELSALYDCRVWASRTYDFAKEILDV